MKTWQKIKGDSVLRNKLLARETVVDAIRSYLKSAGMREVFTPLLVPTPSIEPNLDVFETTLTTGKGNSYRAFLTMSPEYAIKKILSGGVGSVFEITRAFRNKEEVSSTHNPEFTMLEWYRVEADYTHIMQDFEQLFIKVISAVNPAVNLNKWTYQGETYNLALPWPRWSVAEAFQNHCGIDTKTLLDEKNLLAAAKQKGYTIETSTTWEQVFYQLLFNEIEPAMKKTGQPVFLYDYPTSQASLSRKKADDPRFAERFEVFLAGMELGNCFSELLDEAEQRQRFTEDYAARKTAGKTLYSLDEDLLLALKTGLPTVSGIAVGVDRLVMLAIDAANIAETLFFPADELFDLE